jgi:hypothetical protein
MSSLTVPTTTVTNLGNLLTLYQADATLNNMPSYIPWSGSIFNTYNCKDSMFTVFVKISSGSISNFANSGSRWYLDWSLDGSTWLGTGSNTGYTGSIPTAGAWNALQITGSAPYWRFIIVNRSGSAVSGSVLVLGH